MSMQDEHKANKQEDHGQAQSRILAERPTSIPSSAVLQPEPGILADDEDGINLLELWRVLVKRKWTILTFFVIVVTAVITATFLQTPIYRATITLQIERQVPKVVEFQNAAPVDSTSSGDFYQTQYELLKSRSLAERVLDQLNLRETTLAPRERSLWKRFTASLAAIAGQESVATESQAGSGTPLRVGALLAGLTVQPIRNSSLVTLHYDSPDTALAARILNAWAQTFINTNLERRIEASSHAKNFLQEQLQQIKARLEDSEVELIDFARREEIINIDIDDRQTIIGQNLQQMNAALASAGQERIKAEVLYQQMQKARNQGLTQILESPVIQGLKQTKATLEADYQQGLKIYKPAYPKMVQLESQIAEIQATIDQEVANIRSAIEANYQAAMAQEAALTEKLQAITGEVMALQNRSIQYNILKREVDTNRQLYDGLLQQFKEVGVAGVVDTNNVSIVDKALPGDKFKPSLSKNALLAIFLGLLGGIGLAFLFEHLDDTVKQPDDLERQLGIPVLGIIPVEKGGHRKGQDRTRLALVSQEDPRSAFAEAYRSVRTALQFSTSEGVPKVLLVTSSAAGEGKSTTALSLAIQFAQAGKTVLLIDSDLRNPSLHRSLAVENGYGLTNYLAGDAKPAEVAKPTTIPNLFLMPSGHLPPNPAELLASAKMVSLLSLGAAKFDQVILDCPPVLGLADALILGNLAGGTLLVVEAGTTRRGHVQGALKRLKTARTHMLGGILTKLDNRSGAYGYYQSYYYYYGDAASAKKQLPV